MRSLLSSLLAFLSLSASKPNFGFEPHNATIDAVHAALFSGRATCRDIVSLFISQIETYNPQVNAIITLNPTALDTADALDAILRGKRIENGDFMIPTGAHNATIPTSSTSSSSAAAAAGLPPLFCIPMLVKDNINTFDMPTTGGSLALSALHPNRDAPVLSHLRRAGAILLAKTNLHELALEGISVSSLGGQTLNPYDLSRTPGGSSGGTGAGLAAGFGVLGLGTDTMNSVRSPASACGVVGMRPGWGLVDTQGVMPASFSQDVVGPMTRGVRDAATLLSVMEGGGVDHLSASLDVDEGRTDGKWLQGMRFGVVETFFNRTASASSDPDVSAVNTVIESALRKLHDAGATLIPITNSLYNSTDIHATMDLQIYEFQTAMDSYLSSHQRTTSPNIPASLSALYAPGSPFLLLPNQYPQIAHSLHSSPQNISYIARKQRISSLRSAIRSTFSTFSLHALIYPHQTTLAVPLGSPSQRGRNGILAAVTGFPAIALPAGYSPPSENAKEGVPVGMEILGLQGDEGRLLELAERMEGVLGAGGRVPPVLKRKTVREWKRHVGVPEVVPDRKNIPKEYPLGIR
ncbi:Amidase family protein [Coccidioides posadasii C735 delta SOWgp]|uniref:Amidase family protein n=1 Tax=Coccidioides posadasii (strain C735) TaxID=222929 RepID=C5PF20_COCP7|nr:Amidase family protein [Coccidioides posadasii C735 delta SOWgp]EER24600.1 Amidase family protein [Coccidioides posadasii C735 delta SOWgp]|eukprot:XP_003066745.1 Amidase family protein [Coccidioides posadasii C735 delta SOWgp]